MTLENIKIKSTDGLDSLVEFTFDDGTKLEQKISNLSIDDESLVNAELTAYAKAYLSGKEVEKKTAEEGLIGKVLTPELPIDPVI